MISFLDVISVSTWVHFRAPKSTKIMTWRCLRHALGILGSVLGHLVASWKSLEASEDSNHCFLKVKSLKILTLRDSVRSWEAAWGG